MLLVEGGSAVGLWRKSLLDYLVKWDLDGNGRLDVGDLILVLQVQSGAKPRVNLLAATDVDADGLAFGLAEALYVSQSLSGIR